MKKTPKLQPPTVVTESEFTELDGLLSSWLLNQQAQSSLKEDEAEFREELQTFTLQHISDDNHTPFPGVVIQMRSAFTYDCDAALKWATDDKNISGTHSMLQVDEAGMMRLVSIILTTDPETADRLKECLSIRPAGYAEALREQTHVGMPPFTRDDVPVLALTKQNVKIGEALRDTLKVVPDPVEDEADALAAGFMQQVRNAPADQQRTIAPNLTE